MQLQIVSVDVNADANPNFELVIIRKKPQNLTLEYPFKGGGLGARSMLCPSVALVKEP